MIVGELSVSPKWDFWERSADLHVSLLQLNQYICGHPSAVFSSKEIANEYQIKLDRAIIQVCNRHEEGQDSSYSRWFDRFWIVSRIDHLHIHKSRPTFCHRLVYTEFPNLFFWPGHSFPWCLAGYMVSHSFL